MRGWQGTEGIDHKARAQLFHRRAQRAEAALETSQREARGLLEAYLRMRANRNTAKTNARRARALLRDVRLGSMSNLERIIDMGKRFP